MLLPLIAVQLLWLQPWQAAAVSDKPPCRPATQCLAARRALGRAAEPWCTLSDGSRGLRCRRDAPRQQRKLGLAAMAPLIPRTPNQPLQLAPDADPRQAHLAGVSAMQSLRQDNERLQVSSGPNGGVSPSQMLIWNSPFSPHAQQMAYDALQHIATMKRMGAASGRGRRRRQAISGEGITPSKLSIWNSPSSAEAQTMGKNAWKSLMFMLGRGQDTNELESNELTRRRIRRQAEQHKVPGCTPEPHPNCDPGARYRSASGECNNLQQPLWGRSLTQQSRLLPNTYADNVFSPRRHGRDGQDLPTARVISQRTIDGKSSESNDHTLSVMQWGQFIDHDITQVPVFRLDSGAGIECCEADGGELPGVPRHPLCIPISVAAEDPFYSKYRLRCMNMVRSLPAPEPDCIARPASQLNAPTHYLDGSNVYGSTTEHTAELRSFTGGLLRTSDKNMLPDKGTPPFGRPSFGRSLGGGCPHAGHHRAARMIGEPPNGQCLGSVCFQAGDERVNEQGGLVAVHTTFMRLHNHIAVSLQRRHPDWDDERLFQESRRVLVAQWQHVIYNEWLPTVIGHEFASRHGLLPLLSGYSSLYSPTVNPSVATEFSTAAFRFGHSMVRDKLTLIGADGNVKHTLNLTSTFFQPNVVKQWGLADFSRMLTTMRSENFDMSVATSVHEKLFNGDQQHGLDLIALNVQRGREHGIPTYASTLAACTGRAIRDFADLLPVMAQKDITRLMSVYRDVADVDLFVGSLAERAAEDALVGPTFRCIIAQQFFGLRYGDRFFYDNGGMKHSFTPRQLQELRKASWAGILCDTLGEKYGDDFNRIQPLAFIMPSQNNRLHGCRSAAISRVDLSVF